ncbi:MAG: UDP-3-O-(3-hydroxymyristoyl)glucosamine N-acyltransferase [Bacteroidales bacterium]|nr:UDP-3-O-(3-hydroxymyristoyl)glucosamine N-acyltransferase [Bacteroidales bacterium]
MKFNQEFTVFEIANLLNLSFKGDANTKINGISDVRHVTFGDITFADNDKYFNLAQKSPASAIIVENKIYQSNKVLLISNCALDSYNELVSYFFKPQKQKELINENTIVGKGTIIYPNVFIGENCTIGENCIIYSGVKILNNTTIKNNVTIYPGVTIACDPFYYKKENNQYKKILPVGGVEIEDFVEIGANSVIERGLGGNTTIKKGTKIGSNVIIGYDTVIGENCIIAPLTGIGSNVIVEDNVTIWAQVGVQKNVIIGKNAIILGQSGVVKSLEGDKVYFGTPAIESYLKMKELAYLKQIPELIKIFNEKT